MNCPPDALINAARDLASTSTCAKSRRGVVIFDPATTQLISGGYNSPPAPTRCDGSHACRANCNKLCEHAEMAALRVLNTTLDGLELVHVKVSPSFGLLLPSGPPSCWQCSRSIARDSRIGYVWLFHASGWARYSTSEFHTLTLATCGLPII